jgi:hypothetical protein
VPLTRCLNCRRLRSAARMKRGLCRSPACWGDPAVRARFPCRGPAHLGVGAADPRRRDFAGPAPPPPAPACVPPGPAKLPLLAERAAAGVALFPTPDPRRGPREPCLDLREKALPYGVKYPRVWRVLAALCPAVVEFLSPG